MELKQYAELVASMRAVQRRFFGGERTSAVVAEAKRLEKSVDAATAAVLNPPEPTLFDRADTARADAEIRMLRAEIDQLRARSCDDGCRITRALKEFIESSDPEYLSSTRKDP